LERQSEFTLRRRVQFHETDAAGTVHFSRYLLYMEEAEHAFWRAAGLSIAPLEADYGWPRAAVTCEYRAPLRFEDEFEIHIRIVAMTQKSMRYACVLTLGDVVVATLEQTPKNATHWSRAKMAERSGLSSSTIGRIWKAFDLKPHLADTFKLSNDPLFVEKVFDVVGLYLNPPEGAVVLCCDEKSQVQALARSQPAFPMMPGMPERRTHDYVRHGTTSLFAAFNTADGTVISSLHRRHRTIEFKKFLTKIDTEVPDHLDIHLVVDNYGTHKTPAIKAWLARHPRFHIHYTPTYSSWLNQVERWFAYLTDDLLRRGDHRSVQALEKDIRDWTAAWNDNPRPFIWTKTAEQILQRLGRLMQRITGEGH